MNNRLVRTAAEQLDLVVDAFPDNFLRISDGAKSVYSRDFNFAFESLTGFWMCGNKHLTPLLLRDAGLPVADFTVFDTRNLGAAFAAFDKLQPPLVVKPCFGVSGAGITVGVKTRKQFRSACYLAALSADRLILERHVPGRQWRITLLDGELLFACERLPAFVTADGKSSIKMLVTRHNQLIACRDGFPEAFPIPIDRETRAALAEQDLTLGSIPAAGSKVILKRICHSTAGGVTADVTQTLHEDYLNLARKAAATLGARLAGVDIIAPDLSMPLDRGAVVSEVHTTPSFLLRHFDVSGTGDGVASVRGLLSRIFAVGTSG